jgi:hypothetical protein
MNDLDLMAVPMPDYGAKNHRPFNRGQKLKNVVEQSDSTCHKPGLISSMSINDCFQVRLLFLSQDVSTRKKESDSPSGI